ncbi:MAG: hypothetical protein KKE02_20735 [Alphaproteobacteria bacterium]|nr:hypothetical protein [Alphaproteobacteria bacterium]MBU1514539.1 hypothetical protein [Alphaproteobacteria bacterium]MBU2096829.1 hypothetical protein [Alphaproteobacteria bacterium]MBU2153456.1 hypothetical protein [Alphaproteobacteria bacterium]MBU2306039.1 hypothetical protein [Alphaproteobacteria bacterium]
MLGLRAGQLKTLVAALCVALSAFVSAQFAVAAVDRLEHDFGVQHAANAVAGPLSYEHVDADHHPDHDEIAASDPGSPEPVTHHHHGDGPQLVILLSDASSSLFVSRGVAPIPGATPAPPSAPPGGLERPPRPNDDRFA